MKTYKTYALYAINILCIILITASFFTLEESIQNEQKKQKEEGQQVFVAENILPDTPRVMKIAQAKMQIKEETKKKNVTYSGNISYYGPDCVGCSGIAASGYNIRKSIYYHDKTYGKLRIVAADSSIPFGTVVNIKSKNTDIKAIVLDRGGAIGFKRKFLFDLLCKSERQSYQLGVIYNASVEVLRKGF